MILPLLIRGQLAVAGRPLYGFAKPIMETSHRNISSKIKNLNNQPKKAGESTVLYTTSIVIAMFAAAFASIPLYKLYCQATGKGGQAFKDTRREKIAKMEPDSKKLLTIKFAAQTHKNMPWSFTPVQDRVMLRPGETSLAFYRVKNPLDEPVIGIATYTVLPYEAGQYFNKIQCFCFEEQILQPHEDVFMPVLFYIDPEFCKDPNVANYDEIVLSYVFFRSKDGEIPDLDQIKH